jgi:hypothetical protein
MLERHGSKRLRAAPASTISERVGKVSDAWLKSKATAQFLDVGEVGLFETLEGQVQGQLHDECCREAPRRSNGGERAPALQDLLIQYTTWRLRHFQMSH